MNLSYRVDTMSALTTGSLPQTVASRFAGARWNEQCLHSRRVRINTISFTGKVSAKATLRAVRCYATQTQNMQMKSSTATIQRADPNEKVNGPKLDDGSGGFPPFRFGKGGGGGGGGGGGSSYFGGFFLFACVLLLDYLKEIERNLLLQRHQAGDQASIGLV
ncbi:hypothetical protein EJB05_42424 [Eragrostis curvula]|uniref:Uncharacterized protein n=1 Tax=Eragrostis curvula TaxID=38414 RepID=A0A5J9TEF4_9POAL|nr:hypothetical protein EJB05_42424 [Eragrostis curvula]